MFNFFIYHKYLNNLLMKNYLLLSTMLLMSTPLSVSAYTANQIASTGKCWIALNHSDESVSDFGGRMGNVPFDIQGNYDIEVDSKGNLYITKALAPMYEGQDAYFEDNSDIALTISGDKAKIAFTKNLQAVYIEPGSYGYKICMQMSMYLLGSHDGTLYCLIPSEEYNNRPSEGDNEWTGDVTYNSDGSYTITMNDFFLAKATFQPKAYLELYNNDGRYIGDYYSRYYTIDKEKCCGGLTIRTYNPKDTATDTFYSVENETTENRQYTVDVELKADGKMTIENWGNLGQANVCTFAALSPGQTWQTAFNQFEGEYNFGTKEVLMKTCNRLLSPYSQTGFMYEQMIHGDLRNVSGETMAEDIEGTIDCKIAHKGGNLWLNGSSYITQVSDVVFNFPKYGIGDSADDDTEDPYFKIAEVTNTRIPVDGMYEYTHDVDFKAAEMGLTYFIPTDEYYVRGEIDPASVKNPGYVDHYELHIIPGEHSDDEVTNAAFMNWDKGHDLAVNISDPKYYESSYPTEEAPAAVKAMADNADAAQAANSDGRFLRKISAQELKDANAYNADHKYTVYLKAVYTGDSGLEPSFHALHSLGEPVVTGLDNIYGDVKGNVEVNGTTVTLSNTADKGMIATTTGTIVYQGGDATVDLAPGVYVVRAGSYVGKIIIR